MLIIAERINTSRTIKGVREIEEAVVSRNADFIKRLAITQAEAGATYIDINAGTLTSGEPEALEWLVKTVQSSVDLPISFDTPNQKALQLALPVYDSSKGRPFIDPITAEESRYSSVLPFVLEYKARVIALAMDDSGVQQDAGKRLDIARTLITNLTKDGVSLEDIYVDPLTFPIGTGSDVTVAMLEIITTITKEFPGVHTIAGISNVSHGLPSRKLLNQAATVLAMGAGLDAAIIDPNDKYLMALIASTDALLGKDDYCMEYITKSRAGQFEGL